MIEIKVAGIPELERDLLRLGAEIDDMQDVMARLAHEGASLAASFAPRRSGNLAASIRGTTAKNEAIVTAGSAAVPYAGVINYGWPKRNIEPSRFLQRAIAVMQTHIESDVERAINKLIAAKGLK